MLAYLECLVEKFMGGGALFVLIVALFDLVVVFGVICSKWIVFYS